MKFTTILSLLATATLGSGYQISATPHDRYSSSVGVLGCHINTDRVAYFPNSVDCNNICIRVSANGRSVHLLRIDQSGGAHDMSYDAWNYLVTGQSARDHPVAGGGVAMDVQDVDISNCLDLIHTPDKRLPLSGANSMNYVASCWAANTWVGRNFALYNILNPVCTYGYDEVCHIDLASGQNQATCPHQLGVPAALNSVPVYDVRYPTGQVVLAV